MSKHKVCAFLHTFKCDVMYTSTHCISMTKRKQKPLNPGTIRITAVGDGGVGKTFMLVRYATKEIPLGYEPTVFENHYCTINYDGNDYEATLIDTAGQEGFEKLRNLSYPNTDCFLLCFAINSKDSFLNLSYVWVKDIRKMNKKAKILVIGTKSDLKEESLNTGITEQDILKFVKDIKADGYLECSAYTKQVKISPTVSCADVHPHIVSIQSLKVTNCAIEPGLLVRMERHRPITIES
ncbi:hypothetical protein Trydic_g8234 [Trypoxylus dichotomus]